MFSHNFMPRGFQRRRKEPVVVLRLLCACVCRLTTLNRHLAQTLALPHFQECCRHHCMPDSHFLYHSSPFYFLLLILFYFATCWLGCALFCFCSAFVFVIIIHLHPIPPWPLQWCPMMDLQNLNNQLLLVHLPIVYLYVMWDLPSRDIAISDPGCNLRQEWRRPPQARQDFPALKFEAPLSAWSKPLKTRITAQRRQAETPPNHIFLQIRKYNFSWRHSGRSMPTPIPRAAQHPAPVRLRWPLVHSSHASLSLWHWQVPEALVTSSATSSSLYIATLSHPHPIHQQLKLARAASGLPWFAWRPPSLLRVHFCFSYSFVSSKRHTRGHEPCRASPHGTDVFFLWIFFVVGQWPALFFFSALWVSTGSRVEMQVRSAQRPLSTLLIVFLLGNFMFPLVSCNLCQDFRGPRLGQRPAYIHSNPFISFKQQSAPLSFCLAVAGLEGCSPSLVFASVNFCSRCWRNAAADARFPQNRKLLKKNLG